MKNCFFSEGKILLQIAICLRVKISFERNSNCPYSELKGTLPKVYLRAVTFIRVTIFKERNKQTFCRLSQKSINLDRSLGNVYLILESRWLVDKSGRKEYLLIDICKMKTKRE